MKGSIISVKDTNLAYVRPHILKVNGNDYLLFEDAKIVFIKEYINSIRNVLSQNVLSQII